MHSLMLLTALSLGAADLEDGTILYLTNSNAVVETVTRSKISHVAVIVNVSGKPYVYEATPAKVRRLPMDKYRKEIAESNRRRRVDMQLYAREPKKAFTRAQRESMKRYLDEQLNRRYSVKSYVWRKPSAGVHCAELIATALTRAKREDFSEPQNLNPFTLVFHTSDTYKKPTAIALPAPRADLNWCQRSWIAWSSCKKWCSWACVEACTFCW